MSKQPGLPLSAFRLDTKTVPDLQDLTTAEIKHLVKADMGIHSLMSAYMVRPQYFGMQSHSSYGVSSAYTQSHILCLVPPMVATCYLQVLAAGTSATVTAAAFNLAGSAVGGNVSFDITGDVELIGDVADYDTMEKYYISFLKIAQTYSSSGPLVLKASPTWDPEPVHIKFTETGNARLYGCLVQFVYKTT